MFCNQFSVADEIRYGAYLAVRVAGLRLVGRLRECTHSSNNWCLAGMPDVSAGSA